MCDKTSTNFFGVNVKGLSLFLCVNVNGYNSSLAYLYE